MIDIDSIFDDQPETVASLRWRSPASSPPSAGSAATVAPPPPMPVAVALGLLDHPADRAGSGCGWTPTLYLVGDQLMTWAERAEHYRDQWRVAGLPPGITPAEPCGDAV